MTHAVSRYLMSRHGAYAAQQAVPIHSVTSDDEYAIAVPVSSSMLPVPPSSDYTAIGLGVTFYPSAMGKYKPVPPKYYAFVPCVCQRARQFATLSLTLVQKLYHDGDPFIMSRSLTPLERSNTLITGTQMSTRTPRRCSLGPLWLFFGEEHETDLGMRRKDLLMIENK